VVSHLEREAMRRRIEVFFDEKLPPGTEWEPAIDKALRSASVGLVLVTPRWANSPWARKELELLKAARDDSRTAIIWVPVERIPSDSPEAEVLAELAGLNAAFDKDLTLAELEQTISLEAALARVTTAVLSAIDPLWAPITEALPSKYELQWRISVNHATALYCALDRGLRRRVTVRALRRPSWARPFALTVRRMTRLGANRGIPDVLGAYFERDPNLCVMEWIDGTDLRRQLSRHTQCFSAEQVVGIAADVAETLSHAHQRGVEHLDLRPSKVMLKDSGRAIVAGTSKVRQSIGAARQTLVREGRLHLSKEQTCYVAPEHFFSVGAAQTGHSDQYMLGLMMYELLTGELPPVVQNPEAVAQGELPRFDNLPDLVERAPHCPDTLAGLIARMTEPAPENRLRDMAEVARALRAMRPVHVTMAQESWSRLTSEPESRDLFMTRFYEELFDRVPRARAMFSQVDMGEQHRRLESAVYALLWFARDPRPDKFDAPNPLLMTARLHRKRLKLAPSSYDAFGQSLITTATSLDPRCAGASETFIDSAWRTAIDPGIRYMNRHGTQRRHALSNPG